ncbi:hypothetical protein R0J90_12915, partial [Micrococcus sp. SIMBA_144]
TTACIGVSWIWFFGLAISGRVIGRIDSKGQLTKRLNRFLAIVIWGMAGYILFQILKNYM